MFSFQTFVYAFFFLSLNLYLPPIFSDMRNLKSCCHVAQDFRFNNLKYQHIGRLSSVFAESFSFYFFIIKRTKFSYMGFHDP